MSWLNGLFKNDDSEKPIAAIGGESVEPQTVDAVGDHATAKIKLNFKRIPKKLVQTMADQTTGQTVDRKEGERSDDKRRSDLMRDFNAAAKEVTSRRDDRDLMARAPLAPARPRAPSLSL